MASIKLKGDTSGEITISSPSVAGTNTLELQATSGTLATTAQASIGMKNLIINGNMAIDQRNAGASGSTTSNVYTTDRWQFQIFGVTNAITYQQVTDAPIGFNNSLKFTSNATTETAASNITVSPRQRIEGYNIAHLGWGTANAKTVTVSFWAKASISGVYPLAINNSAFNTSYVSEYTISSANTWEYKTITITGPTIGTWSTDNGRGLVVLFTISAGSNVSTSSVNTWQSGNYRTTTSCVQLIENSSATLQITGVQLEAGTTATPFENLQYGQQLALCQRYYFALCDGSIAARQSIGIGAYYSSTDLRGTFSFPTTMRSTPTLEVETVTDGYDFRRVSGVDRVSSFTLLTASLTSVNFNNSTNASGTAGTAGELFSDDVSAFLAVSAEL